MYYGFLLTYGLAVPRLVGIHLPWDTHHGEFLSYDFVYSRVDDFHSQSLLYLLISFVILQAH
jgi:hypothetical protein